MAKIILKCTDPECEVEGGREFFFSEKEQKFYKEQGYTQPKRCWQCRQRRRNRSESPFKGVAEVIAGKSDKEILESK